MATCRGSAVAKTPPRRGTLSGQGTYEIPSLEGLGVGSIALEEPVSVYPRLQIDNPPPPRLWRTSRQLVPLPAGSAIKNA